MGLLIVKNRPVWITGDGIPFTSPMEASNHQLKITLEETMKAKGFRPSPGEAGKWSWNSVIDFMVDNREKLTILFENVKAQNAQQET